MPDTSLSGHVWPEDTGTGTADGNEDWDSAGYIGGMAAKDNASDYVEAGLSITPTYTTPAFDLSAGLAFIKHTGSVTVQNPSDDASTYSGTWDQGVTLAVDVDAQTGIALTDSAVNRVYLAVDLTSNDGHYVRVDTEASPNVPTDPYIKIAEIDTTNDTLTEYNRNPNIRADEVTPDEVAGIKYVHSGLSASEVVDLINNGSNGDWFIFAPKTSWTVSQQLTPPIGATLMGSGYRRRAATGPILKKGFNGNLIDLPDFCSVIGLFFDGNKANFTGDNIVTAKDTREIYLERVMSYQAAGDGFAGNVFLSTVMASRFDDNDGWGFRQNSTSSEAPHNNIYGPSYMTDNGAGGILLADNQKNVGVEVLVEGNAGPGIEVRAPIDNTQFRGGAINNDGPGVLVNDSSGGGMRGITFSNFAWSDNALNPDAGLTTPVGGSIHSEAGRFSGAIIGGYSTDTQFISTHEGTFHHIDIIGGHTGNAQYDGDVDGGSLRVLVSDRFAVEGNFSVNNAIAIDRGGANRGFYDLEAQEHANRHVGSSTQSGDGSTTTFSVINGSLGNPIDHAQVTAASADANGDFHIDVLSGRVDIHYETAPPSGTNNLSWEYVAHY